MLSATLMEGYLRAASEVSRLAVGDPVASPREATYRVTRWASQLEQVEGAPYGTRGGISVVHNFPADGEYRFRVSFHHETTGALYGSAPAALHTLEAPEQIELSVNGERVAAFDIDRWMHVSDPDGVNLRTEPIFVAAGPQRISAAFVRQVEGPVQDLISPHDWSIASTSIADAYGLTSLPHLRDLAITGPYDPTGVSETPTRARIFTCRPEGADGGRECARSIIQRLGGRAYRRPLSSKDEEALLALYDVGYEEGGFEFGVRTALEGILASPHFTFRFEEPPGTDGDAYRLADSDLASRLSFFLWGTAPDEELTRLAADGKLSDAAVLEAQVEAHAHGSPRARPCRAASPGSGCGSRIWRRSTPTSGPIPTSTTSSSRRDADRDRAVLLEPGAGRPEPRSTSSPPTTPTSTRRLARHYGIDGVTGDHFRRVTYPDERRRGLLGHGSILTLTSHASRTSPVLRGKWVMEVLLGSPPPPPPPGVPELEETGEADGDAGCSRFGSSMERHRANPVVQRRATTVIDPIGPRARELRRHRRVANPGQGRRGRRERRALRRDARSAGRAQDLRAAIASRNHSFIRTFTENLMAYALGRRVEYFDMPTIRAIEREAAANDHRMSSFILGIVESPAFQWKAAPTDATDVRRSR